MFDCAYRHVRERKPQLNCKQTPVKLLGTVHASEITAVGGDSGCVFDQIWTSPKY